MSVLQTITDRDQELYNKIAPALSLIDDPDDDIAYHIAHHLSEFGASIVPILRNEITLHDSIHAKHTIINTLHILQGKALYELKDYIAVCEHRNADPDVFATFDLLSHFGYPESNAWIIEAHINAMTEAVLYDIQQTHAHNEQSKINSLNNVFFDQFHYRPPSSHYYLPEHCFLHSVTEHKVGIPLALSILYIILGNRCGIPLHGIGMPLHFLVKSKELDTYIDVYNYGVSLSKEDCLNFLIKANIPYSNEMLAPVSTVEMLYRMLRNLHHCYKRETMDWEFEKITEVLHHFNIEH